MWVLVFFFTIIVLPYSRCETKYSTSLSHFNPKLFIMWRSLYQNNEFIRVVDSRVLLGEFGETKVWTIQLNDENSLFECLMGRCASVLNSDNFRKISAQRLANEMVDAESDILTFHFWDRYKRVSACTRAMPLFKKSTNDSGLFQLLRRENRGPYVFFTMHWFWVLPPSPSIEGTTPS